MWGLQAAGDTPSLTGELTKETHMVLEYTQAHPLENYHQTGPICLWAEGKVIESGARAEQATLFPLGPLPNIKSYNASK